MEEFKKIKTFKSKKNQVELGYLGENLVVKKIFNGENDCFAEAQNYKKIEFNKPELIFQNNTSLYYGYIEGDTLADYITPLDKSCAKQILSFKNNIDLIKEINQAKIQGVNPLTPLMQKVAQLFFEALENNSFFISDVNLRNFIVHSSKIFIVDFEKIEKANLGLLSSFLAFYLTNQPFMSDNKLASLNDFLSFFKKSFDLAEIIRETEKKVLSRCREKNLDCSL